MTFFDTIDTVHRLFNGLKAYSYCDIKKITLNPKTNAVESLETNYGTIKTKRIINCAGVWAPEIGNMVGIHITIEPRKGTNLISEKCEKLCNNKILEYGYMMSKFDGINFKRNVSPLVEEQNIFWSQTFCGRPFTNCFRCRFYSGILHLCRT